MQLAAEYKKPTIVARINEEGYIKGSGRGLNESELKDFKQFLQESSLFEYCEGHPNAFGCSIKEANLDSLLNYSNIELKDINFNEEFFDINFIFNANEDFSDLIYEIDKIKETFGQKNPEPLIVVENIIVTKKNITIMGESQNTVKIIYNNMTYILFKAEDFITTTLNLDEFNLDIIGKANLNYYGGRYTPQIKIETYELKIKNKFDF